MYKVTIVDDEQKSIDNLCYLLSEYISDELLISQFCNPIEAQQDIIINPPDLLFLDIQMPEMSGFDLLKSLENVEFKIIFTTAHADFAIDAIRLSALDYLLKPIDDELLIDAFKRFKSSRVKKSEQLQISQLLQNIHTKANANNERITIASVDGLHYVNINEIIRIEADGNYSTIILENGRQFLSSKNLKKYEVLLPTPQFLRVHYTHIVNRDFVQSFLKGETIVLSNGHEIPTSRRRRKDIKRDLGRS